MNLQPISVKDLRENFPRVRKELSSGLSYLLIYRSKPIAEIRPLLKDERKNKVLEVLANPPKKLQFQSNVSAVKLIRRERD